LNTYVSQWHDAGVWRAKYSHREGEGDGCKAARTSTLSSRVTDYVTHFVWPRQPENPPEGKT